MNRKLFRTWLFRGLLIFVMAAVATASLPTFAQAAFTDLPSATTAPSCKAWVIVKTGDSLNSIAKSYNVVVKNVVKQNKIPEPYTIYVGDILCIPAKGAVYSNQDLPTYAKLLAANFSVTKQGYYLTVATTNFPKNSTYYVKVYDLTKLPAFAKIGKINTDGKPNKSYQFLLPKPLRSIVKMQVCLKNAATDRNVCRPVK